MSLPSGLKAIALMKPIGPRSAGRVGVRDAVFQRVTRTGRGETADIEPFGATAGGCGYSRPVRVRAEWVRGAAESRAETQVFPEPASASDVPDDHAPVVAGR